MASLSRRSLRWLLLVLGCAITTLFRSASATEYDERLLLKPLPEAAVLASFSFTSNTTVKAYESQNFEHFPRSLGQILQHAHTKELHLRFSSGRWDDQAWGPRPQRGSREGGTGVELWAWVEAETDEEANSRWLALTNALSGLFCASLNFVDETRTIRPALTFEPEGHHGSESSSRLHLLHGTLPGEVVCTENLTPILKLLPCKGKAGISSLFDGHKLFDSAWQAMAIDVRPVCDPVKNDCFIEMEQTVNLVLDIERSKRPRDDPIPRPAPIETIRCDESKYYHQFGDSCFPLAGAAMPAFSIEELFGRQLKGSCPLAGGSETVCIDLTEGQTASANTSAKFNTRALGDGVICYSLPDTTDFDIQIDESNITPKQMSSAQSILAERRLTGSGQENGGVEIVLTNPSTTDSIDLVYLESLPWFMKPYMHTLDTAITPLPNSGSAAPQPPSVSPIKQMIYRPAIDRRRATHLELVLSMPPASQLTLTYRFEKAILRYAEYPPDANRGFNAPPSVVRMLSADKPTYLRTTCLLLYLPTPDFSMPYNVIILTSTVIALGFGSIFNILVRRYVAADEVDAVQGGGVKGRIGRLLGRVKDRIGGKAKGKME